MSFRESTTLALALASIFASFLPAARGTAQEAVRLTREEARTLAIQSGPRFLAAKARGEAARGVARTDRVYPFNPKAEMKGVEAFDPGGWGDYEATLSQEIEWAGQWFVRRSAGNHAREAASGEEREAIRALFLELDRTFFRLRAAEERARVSAEGAEMARTLRDAVQAQLREGQISTLEMNLTNIETGRAEARALAARNELARAQQALREILGLGATAPVTTQASSGEPGFDPSDVDALVESALAHRPDVRAAKAREQEAISRRRLASLQAIPNVELGVVAKRSAIGSDPTYGLRIALPIPLWNRNQGQRDQFQALEELRRVERMDTELRARGEVLTFLGAYRTATEELEIFTSSVLTPARENRDLLQRAYEVGRLNLPTTLLLQTQLLDSELAYWEAWLRQREALAQVEAALGDLPG